MLHKFLAPSKLTARAAESLVTIFRSDKLHSVTSYLNLHSKLLIANEKWQMEAISAAQEPVGARLPFQGYRDTISLFTGEGLKPVA